MRRFTPQQSKAHHFTPFPRLKGRTATKRSSTKASLHFRHPERMEGAVIPFIGHFLFLATATILSLLLMWLERGNEQLMDSQSVSNRLCQSAAWTVFFGARIGYPHHAPLNV
eukprot:scaffold8015_cov165-Ochromonas_danica.AAC.25